MRGEVTFSRLLPQGPDATARELLAEVRARDRAPAGRPFVFVNMVSTVDGRAQIHGRTGELGEEADLEMLLELRTLADAVLIGPGTLRVESYARLVGSEERRAHRVALGLPEDPPAVLLSRALNIRWDAGLFAAPEQPVLVYAGVDADGEPPETAAPVEVVRLDDPTPEAMLADLRARGIAALLTEGGPTLNSALLTAGVADELFLTIAPVITGEVAALRIVEGEGLPGPMAARPVWVLHAQDELFLRYALGRGLASTARPRGI
jgi:riboflavin biosynthesis pyrimidine reductase